MSRSTLILGQGHIGQKLHKLLNYPISGKRIESFDDAEALIKQYNPKVIINTIGFSGERNVDDCENHLQKTLQANTIVPLILAETAIRHNIKLITIGSGCVYHYDYDKDKPIAETKEPDFYELYYSRSKIYAQKALENLAKKHDIAIIRIRVPLDNEPHPKNILTKLIQYKKIINIPNSVTYLPDLAAAIKHLIKINAKGVYNIVNKGPLKYADLMTVYKKHVPDFDYEVLDFKKLNMVRTNLILSTRKLENTGLKVRKTKDIINECIEHYLNCS